jgi:hypothetical protein
VTGCDFLWAVCGVVGAVCRAVCGMRAAVRSAVMFAPCTVVAAVRGRCAAVRCFCVACCVRVCDVWCVACWCALFLGDTRHDAEVSLWWVGLVVSCVCRRVCVLCDGSGERGASRRVRAGPVGPSKMRRVVAASFARLYCRMRVLGVHCRRCFQRSE